MTIQQLRCFLVMAEELHYTKAANRLHVSQPSLSYSIAELEKEFGLPLFMRKDNRTVLTDYGGTLLPYAGTVLSDVDTLRMKADELIDPSVGTVHLGIIYSISFDFIPEMLEAFYSDKSNARVTVSVFQGVNTVLTDQLAEGAVDLILAGKSDDPNLDSAYILTQELKLVVPTGHRLCGQETVTLEDLRDEKLISLDESSNIRNHIVQCFRARGIEPQFALSVAECSAMGAFISSGMGVAIAPIVPSLRSNSVCIIPFAKEDVELLGRKIYLQWQKGSYLSPAVRRFRTFVLSEFGEKESKGGSVNGNRSR